MIGKSRALQQAKATNSRIGLQRASLPNAASEFISAMRGTVSDGAKRASRARACVRSVLTSAVCCPTVVEAYLRTGDDPQSGAIST
jgi:hypothetical protein